MLVVFLQSVQEANTQNKCVMFYKILSKRDNCLKYKNDITTGICYMYNFNVYNTIRTFYAQREKND